MKRGIFILAVFLCGCLFSTSDSNVGDDMGNTRDVGGTDLTPEDTGKSDGVVQETCGDGLLQPEETCDPMLPPNSTGSCPQSCDDGEACTIDELTGSADSCDATCSVTVIETCLNNDGCCPANCTAATDTDCDDSAVCGDGSLAEAELCDPGISSGPGSCPTIDDCTTTDACAVPRVAGSFANCDAECIEIPIESCTNGDGCCPPSCGSTNDDDCTPGCGNGIVDPGELCDGNCPMDATDCDDQNPCTEDTLEGTAGTCDARCVYAPVSVCMNNDQCCPSTCDPSNDNDCSMTCGNGSVDAPLETCDDSTMMTADVCPVTCEDMNACTTDVSTGSADNCNRVCGNYQIDSCISADGCCLYNSICNANNDTDCEPQCPNGVVEQGESCDGNCPTTCDDGVACTVDTLVGSASDCSASCMNTLIDACNSGDGCCPPGCNSSNDSDCNSVCGNGIVEMGETCDGNCPVDCDDSNDCTTDIGTGSAMQCNRRCTHNPVTMCTGGDGCCPSGCTAANDSDCSASCGDGIVDAGETCDGDCPTQEDCRMLGACRVLTGSAGQCDAACDDAPGCVECELGGDCACNDGEVCREGKCDLSFSGDECAEACSPNSYCQVFTPGSQCFAQASQCGECLTKNQCAFNEDCVDNFCEEAENCYDARNPLQYCMSQGYPACNMQTGDCWDACQAASDCGDTETCMGGFCMPAMDCGEANDGDLYCAQFGSNLICIGTECRSPCSQNNQNCDCPEPAHQSCVLDQVSGKTYCAGPPPQSCQAVCFGFRNAYCDARRPGSICSLPTPQNPDGCVLGASDMGQPVDMAPDMSPDMGPADMSTADFGLPP